MRAVMLEVPDLLLAERRRLGHDKCDEMWEGELHMAPPPNGEHSRLEAELFEVLAPVARRHGLRVRPDTTGLYDPAVPGQHSYRIPDLSVVDPAVVSERGIEGVAALVVEIHFPGDEAFEKLPFYARVGVGEALVVDRSTKAVRRFAGPGLVEQLPDPDGWHELACLPVRLRGVDGTVEVDLDGAVTSF